MNVLVFLASSYPSMMGQHTIMKIVREPRFTEAQGQFYAQFIIHSGFPYSEELKGFAKRVDKNRDTEALMSLGSMAMSDTYFSDSYLDFEFKADPIFLNWWRTQFTKLNFERARMPSSVFGVSNMNQSPLAYVSYLFFHSGASHLMGNMIFLLIFGTALESVIGSLSFLLTYLITGVASGVVFGYLEQTSSIPLIGASGAVSGIMAMFCVLFWRQGVRYVFFLLPRDGYYGVIYLPAWVAFIKWLLVDLGGYISSPAVLGGGVAYSAHLGGEFVGVLSGVLFLYVRGLVTQNELKAGFIDTRPVFTQVHFKTQIKGVS
jgi:membrane associated rhomboid family serine protease